MENIAWLHVIFSIVPKQLFTLSHVFSTFCFESFQHTVPADFIDQGPFDTFDFFITKENFSTEQTEWYYIIWYIMVFSQNGITKNAAMSPITTPFPTHL